MGTRSVVIYQNIHRSAKARGGTCLANVRVNGARIPANTLLESNCGSQTNSGKDCRDSGNECSNEALIGDGAVHKILFGVHARHRAEIQFVCHGLCQKCNKESRNQVFGNWENILAATFSRTDALSILFLSAPSPGIHGTISNRPDIEIDIPIPAFRVGSNNFGLAMPD